MPLALISLTLPRHTSLLSIASGRSSRLHPVSAKSYCQQVVAGRLTLACPCEVVQRKMLLMSLSLLLQLCPECLDHLIWMVLEMGGRWPYSCCFVGCCFQDLFNTTFKYIYIYIYIYQPLRSGRIWHKVHF